MCEWIQMGVLRFTAAQAAQKILKVVLYFTCKFTAAQAAQKIRVSAGDG